jgi:branched-chain amino acid aminotransferase
MVDKAKEIWMDGQFIEWVAAEVAAVREVDNRSIGEGVVGLITKKILTRFFEAVRGSHMSHPEWLTRV